LKIGNVMEIFDQTDITGVKLRLSTQQSGTVGSEFFCEIWRFDAATAAYVYVAETGLSQVTGTAATWVTLPLLGGPVTVMPGDDILVVAAHFGGSTAAPEVRFAYAQNTYDQSVLGFDATDALFSLSSPGAIMIRLMDEPGLGMNEEVANSFDMNVYPNPANTSATVSFTVGSQADANITVTDLSGKVVYSNILGAVNGTQNVTINTDAMSNGVYMVNLSVDGNVSTQKLIVRK
jgi:hypothetical protein